MSSLTIKAVHISNLKAIDKVDMTGLDSLVLIGGANGAGKSGLIGILQGLVGHSWPDDLLRDGCKKGEGECLLSDGDEVFRVHVTAKKDRPPKCKITQVVGDKEIPITRAREWLKKQLGTDSADILDNIDQFNTPAGERAVLGQMRDAAELDFSDLDKEDAELREQRKFDKRDMAAAEARRDAIPRDADCPTEGVDAGAVHSKLAAAQKKEVELREASAAMARLEREIAQRQQERHDWKTIVDALPDAEMLASVVTSLHAKVAGADVTNQRVRQQAARKEHIAAAVTLAGQIDDATERLDAIAERKRAMLATADFGVPGLTLSDDLATILYEGEPLRRLSDGNKFDVFAMLAAAQNPGIAVLFSKRASLLDPEHMVSCHQKAKAMGMQLIFEVVGEPEGAIVIEATDTGSVVKGTENG